LQYGFYNNQQAPQNFDNLFGLANLVNFIGLFVALKVILSFKLKIED